jgi:hypothetical protein
VQHRRDDAGSTVSGCGNDTTPMRDEPRPSAVLALIRSPRQAARYASPATGRRSCLAEQDRTRWDRELIGDGLHFHRDIVESMKLRSVQAIYSQFATDYEDVMRNNMQYTAHIRASGRTRAFQYRNWSSMRSDTNRPIFSTLAAAPDSVRCLSWRGTGT